MTEPDRPATIRDVEYKGAPLDSERGPGLGCFWIQLVALAILVVLAPLSAAWNWPFWISAALLIAVIVLLLLAGQTVIFLLRLVAADRRAAGRHRPLASRTPTVGQLEDARQAEAAERGTIEDEAVDYDPAGSAPSDPGTEPSESPGGGVRE